MLITDFLLQQRRLFDQIQNSYEASILELVQKVERLQQENNQLRQENEKLRAKSSDE